VELRTQADPPEPIRMAARVRHRGMASEQQQADVGGSVSERIWSWFLPALLCFSLLGATWGSLLFRQAEDERERASLELRLTRSAREAVPLLEKALQAGDELRQRILLETLARLTGGRVGIYSKDGKIVLEVDGHEGVDPVSTIAAEDRGARLTETSAQREVLVWESLLRDDQKVAELRLTASLLASESFPWPFWAGLLGIFGLISAATLLLLTRLLDPMRRVVLVLDELGERNPLDLERPEEIARRVPDLGPALSRCVEGMQKRQLRAEESFVEVAIQLAREFEYHAEGEIGHGQRTRRFASWLGERLRLDPVARDQLDLAALCHDIGRMPTNDGTPWGHESQVEERHAELGAAYFEAMPGLEDVAEIVRHHHSDFDGKGLPENIAGEAIPLGARILRIADEFERLTSGVRLGQPLTQEDALEHMEEAAGRLYDPEVLELFVEEVALRMPEAPVNSTWQDFGVLGGASRN
jgi:putative nucleotidyltransferase with HDIG domain